MAYRLTLLALGVLGCLGTHALPFERRSANFASLFNGKRPLQGVEVNGLFNPMESVSPQLFERASDEAGRKITTYQELCKFLPQDKLNFLMADHFATFITDDDLETLKSANIHSLRIPVTYNTFIPEADRTDKFPKGESRALDIFVERVLDHGMKIWFDLIANPNSKLGILEGNSENTIMPDVTRRVAKFIAQKYDPEDVSAILVHPDIKFSSTPSNLSPLDPKAILNTEKNQYNHYKELSSIFARKGHLLAIDTIHNLDYWADKATNFQDPVILVHSLSTGILSTHQKSASRILTSVKDDLAYIHKISQDLPVAVTWDASLNSCLNARSATSDCTSHEQLLTAMDEHVNHDKAADATLNKVTQQFGKDILNELKKSDIGAWFFRTVKIQSPKTVAHRSLVKRRVNPAVSGNDFLSMYRNGMFDRKDLVTTKQKGKTPIVPIALGIGALGAGGAAGTWGYLHNDEVRKNVDNVAQHLKSLHEDKVKPAVAEAKERLAAHIEKAKAQLSPHIEKAKSLLNSVSNTDPQEKLLLPAAHEKTLSEEDHLEEPADRVTPLPSEALVRSMFTPPSDEDLRLPPMPLVESTDPIVDISQAPEIPEQPNFDILPTVDESPESEPISPAGEYETDYVPQKVDTAFNRNSWGSVSREKLRPVESLIEHYNTPSSGQSSAPSAKVGIGSLPVSVADQIRKLESWQSSPSQSPQHPSLSRYASPKVLTGTVKKNELPVSEIQKEVAARRIAEIELTGPPNVQKRPLKPTTEQDATKRHGKVFTESYLHLLDSLPSTKREKERSPTYAGYQTQGANHRSSAPKSKSWQELERPGMDVSDHHLEEVGKIVVGQVESLTSIQEERYTRAHAGTGAGTPIITPTLAKQRIGQSNLPRATPQDRDHHVIGGPKARPMTVHAPRHKDMDPNHPKNLKKAKLKIDEYIPYPPPEAKNIVKTHHTETHKITRNGKKPFSSPKIIVGHTRKSIQVHQDPASAFEKIGQTMPSAPQSGVGKDPRMKFEDLHWTEEQKAGHQAFVEKFQRRQEIAAKRPPWVPPGRVH